MNHQLIIVQGTLLQSLKLIGFMVFTGMFLNTKLLLTSLSNLGYNAIVKTLEF